MLDLILQAFPYALAFTAPILITALGGLISERSGIINIGLEGFMIVGTFVSAYTVYSLKSVLGGELFIIALLLGALAGGIFSLLLAVLSIRFHANQIITGIAINMMAVAMTKYLARMITGSGTITISGGITRMDIPYLSKIPILGAMLFSKSYMTTFVVILITLVIYYFLHKTIKGLRLKACGENPWAADSLGINVIATRYVAVFVSGCLAGLGGAIIILTYQGEFSGSVSGLGFLAVATLIFGKWDPLKVMGASFLFGFARAFASMSSLNDTLKAIHLPMQFYNALPYIITIIGLVLLSKNAAGPKSAGKPFRLGS